MAKEIQYEFGVMSRKWTLNATSDSYARTAMSIFVNYDVPIAVYAPQESCFYPSHALHSLDGVELDSDELKKVIDSIKEVRE